MFKECYKANFNQLNNTLTKQFYLLRNKAARIYVVQGSDTTMLPIAASLFGQ